MTPASDLDPTRDHRALTLAIFLTVLGAVPLLVLAPAPLADWPNHLARVSITNDLLNGSPFWSARYSFQGILIPNAILDAVVLGLMRLGIPISQAGSTFLLLCYALFVGGFIVLSQARRVPIGIAAALGSIVFYTGLTVYGLVNFITGVGLAMFAAAFWMRDDARLVRRLLIAVVATPVILFCHVVAALVFAGLCGCYDLVRPVRTVGRRAVEALPAAIALMIGLVGYKLSAASSDAMSIIYDGAPGIKSVAIGKLRQIAQALTSGNPVADVLFGCVVIVLGILMWQRRREVRLRFAAPVGALAIVAILAPNGVGIGLLLDTRLFAWTLFLAIALLPWSSRLARRTEVALIAIFLARTVVLIFVWASYAPVYAELRSAFAALPKGSTLLDAYDDTPGFYAARQPPIWNSASLAVNSGIFVPSVFAEPTQQPLAVSLDWRPLWLWSHSANARTAQNLASVRERAARFCSLDHNAQLLFLHVTQKPTFAIESPCKIN